MQQNNWLSQRFHTRQHYFCIFIQSRLHHHVLLRPCFSIIFCHAPPGDRIFFSDLPAPGEPGGGATTTLAYCLLACHNHLCSRSTTSSSPPRFITLTRTVKVHHAPHCLSNTVLMNAGLGGSSCTAGLIKLLWGGLQGRTCDVMRTPIKCGLFLLDVGLAALRKRRHHASSPLTPYQLARPLSPPTPSPAAVCAPLPPYNAECHHTGPSCLLVTATEVYAALKLKNKADLQFLSSVTKFPLKAASILATSAASCM